MTIVGRINRTKNVVGRINSKRAEAAVSWWLSGGIAAANCIAAYQPKGAASYAASLINLANPGTYNAYAGSAPSWSTENGWNFNGSSHYLKSGVTPLSTYSLIVRHSTAAAGYDYITAGVLRTNAGIFLSPSQAPVKNTSISHGTMGSKAGATLIGVLAATVNKGWINGVNEFSTGNFTGTSAEIWIGTGHGATGNPLYYYPGYIIAVAIYDIDISSAVATLTTAMNAL